MNGRAATRAVAFALPVLIGAAWSGPLAASDFILGGTVGAPNNELDLGYRVSGKVVARTGFNTLEVSENFRDDDIKYTTELDVETAHALIDWHILDNGFRLTGGVVFNGNTINGTASVSPGHRIGNAAASSGGTLDLDVENNEFVPYLGVGWGRRVEGWSMVELSVDAGVMFQGRPDIDLDGHGLDGISRSDLEAEERQIRDELDDFAVFPIISLSAKFTF